MMTKHSMTISILAMQLFLCHTSLFGDTATYTGNDMTIDFSIPGGAGVHQCAIAIDTNETAIDPSLLTYMVSRSGTSNTYTFGAINTDMSRNWDLSSNANDDSLGINLHLTSGLDAGDGTRTMLLVITANPDTMLDKGLFSVTYIWHLSISDPGTGIHSYSVAASATTGTGAAILLPEINIKDSTGNLSAGTGVYDFAGVIADGNGGIASPYHEFTIENTGSASLVLTGVALSGAGAGNFDLDSSSMLATVDPAATTSFTIRFDPLSIGATSATVTVGNNDIFEYEYSFTITGNGMDLAPTMVVSQGTTPMPHLTGSYLFDNTVRGASTPVPFTVVNTGTGQLQFTGTSPVSLGGANPSSFAIVSQPDAATVDPAPATASATFIIAFTPQATDTGTRNARVLIASNDPAHPSYFFDISGKVKPTGYLEPPTGLHVEVGGSAVYSGEVPFSLPLHAASIGAAENLKWDITDATASGDIYETITATGVTAQTLRFESPESRTIHFKAIAADGTEGDVTTMTIVAYPNEAVAFPRYQGLPFDNEPPWIDGTLSGWDDHLNPSGSGAADVVYGENGWRGAFSIPFSDGTEPDARIDLVRSSDSLYLGIDVNFDDTLTAEEQIFIGIGKDAGARFDEAGNIGLLTITPLTNAVTLSQKNAMGGWDVVAAPAGMQVAHKPSTDGDPAHWTVEIKLPIGPGTTPSWLDLGNKFLFFARIRRFDSGSGTYSSFTWPRTIPATIATPETIPDYWGTANRDDSLPSNGLYFASYAALGVRADPLDVLAPLTSTILYTDPATGTNTVTNRLVARVSNDAQRATLAADGTVSHEYLAAPDARVTFKMANWGVPSPDARYWTPIVAQPSADPAAQTANPTARQVVPAATALGPGTLDYILDWRLDAAQIAQYAPGTVAVNGLDRRHQCLLAEIDSNPVTMPDAAVNVVSKSIYRNMDFGAQNPGPEAFSAQAEISAQGLESFIADLELRNAGERRILLRIFTKGWKSSRNTLGARDRKLALDTRRSAPSIRYLPELRRYIEDAPGTISFIEYIVKAYVFTGRTLRRNNKDFEEVSPIGSYGYVVRHLSSTESWDFHIEGAQRIDDRTYIITIKTQGTTAITDHVRAIDPPRWSFGLLGGAGYGIPNSGTFTAPGAGGALSASFNVGLDELNRDYALAADLGYDYLPGSGGADPWRSWYLAASFRAGFPFMLQWLRPYLSVGAGVFQDASSDVLWGAALGTGLDIAVSRPVHFRLGADFIGTKTTALLHLSAGLVYRLLR